MQYALLGLAILLRWLVPEEKQQEPVKARITYYPSCPCRDHEERINEEGTTYGGDW